MTDEDLIHQLRNSKGWPTLGNLAADRIEALIAERDALDEAEAALDSAHSEVGHNIWRYWRDMTRQHLAKRREAEARAASAAQEARAVALGEAAAYHQRHAEGYAKTGQEMDHKRHVEYARAILALIDTPAAEALERVQTEERAKGMERAGVILLDHPHWTRWHVLEAIRAEAAAIRAQETDNA